jgi:obg-like ATPase 1
LSHVRAVDGIFQVVRAFDDDEVTHVEGDVNPIRDMEIIQTELRLKDIEWVEKAMENIRKSTRALGSTSLADKARKEELVSGRMTLIFARFDSPADHRGESLQSPDSR